MRSPAPVPEQEVEEDSATEWLQELQQAYREADPEQGPTEPGSEDEWLQELLGKDVGGSLQPANPRLVPGPRPVQALGATSGRLGASLRGVIQPPVHCPYDNDEAHGRARTRAEHLDLFLAEAQILGERPQVTMPQQDDI